MDKSYIVKELIHAAKIYQENLENRNIMFVYKEKEKINYIETKFLKANFLHLTGVKCKNSNANSFYNKCIKKRINVEEIQIRDDGNTQRKIEVLSRNMKINQNAKIICIVSKKIKEKSYNQITYINKNYEQDIKKFFSKSNFFPIHLV